MPPPTTGQSSMQKAKLLIMEATASPSGSPSGGGSQLIEFKFNPETYKISKSATWEIKKAQASPTAPAPAFKGTAPRDLTVQIFLDGTEADPAVDVKADIDKLFGTCNPTVSSGEQNKWRPPYVQFQWGTFVSFHAYMKSVSANYMLFDSNGKPLRATVDLSMTEAPRVPGGQNPTSGALAAHREKTMSAGDSLASLAYAEYGDPTMWRAIAIANDIDDPMRLKPGDQLLIPPLEEAEAWR